MRKALLKPEIVSYLAKKLNLSETTVSKNISLLRRDYGRYNPNVVAHIYARKNNLSVLQKLSPEEKQSLPTMELVKESSKNKNRKSNHIEIKPTKKYGNRLSLKKIIRGCSDYIWWIDKHFSKSGIELLYENINKSKIKEIKILLSINSNINWDGFKKEFEEFSEELGRQKISVSCKVICDKTINNSIHGRFIITKEKNFLVPPINSTLMGQYDQISNSSSKPPFEEWWNSSKGLVEEFSEIKNLSKK